MDLTISGIDPLPSDPNVLRVRVDGRIVARLSRADVEALELIEGQQWTQRLATRVQQAVDTAKARKAALAMLGRRALSRGELSQRLLGKGHDGSIVTAVADELESHGWLDDRAYARAIAEQITRKKPASADLLMQKMLDRKIDPQVAREVADELIARADPVDAAEQFARGKLRSMASLPATTAARRIAGALARRGFDDEIAEAVIQRLDLFEDEH